MALTLLHRTLEVDREACLARADFGYDSLSDLPAKGASAGWVSVQGSAVGTGWYVDGVRIRDGVIPKATISARVPGKDWTWVGLAPIVRRNTYKLMPSSVIVDGEALLTYRAVFSNWPSGSNWAAGEPDPLTGALLTWEPEFVSATNYETWLYKVNGTFASGLTAPVGTAGVFLCKKMAVETEIHVPVSGSLETYYRHFPVFWQAPVIGVTQLVWRSAGTWS